MGKAWGLIQAWADAQPIQDITDAQLARLIGFSQSNFPVWKNPKSVPPRETIGAIAKAIGEDFETVRDAFLEDCGYFKKPTDEEMESAKQARKGRSRGRQAREEQDAAATESQDDGSMEPS